MAVKFRILVAKAGCDIHERGALTMIHVFRDAGMEVIYTGRYQSEANIARTAVAEDVDIIGVSDLTGGLPVICRKLLRELKGLETDIPVFCGGLMTEKDKEEMAAMGVAGTFDTGSTPDLCLVHVRNILETKCRSEGKAYGKDDNPGTA